MSTPVTVNGVNLAKVATTANYTDLVARPKFYIGSSSITTAQSGAPTQPNNMAHWHGTVSTGSNGVAYIYPTVDGTSTGAAIFNSILSVNVVGYNSSPSNGNDGVFATVTSVAANLKSVKLLASTGATSLVAGSGLTYAPSNTLLICTVVGTYSS